MSDLVDIKNKLYMIVIMGTNLDKSILLQSILIVVKD